MSYSTFHVKEGLKRLSVPVAEIVTRMLDAETDEKLIAAQQELAALSHADQYVVSFFLLFIIIIIIF